MGWLLLGRSTGKKRKKRTAPAPAASAGTPWDPARTLAGLRVIGAVALVIVLVAVWRAGYDGLRGYIRDTHARPVTAGDITLADAPAWMSAGVRAEVRQTVARQVSADPLDAQSLRIATEALRRVPWVRQVVQVHRQADGRIVVHALYRRPVAVVQCRDGYRLVGQGGTELLARPYYRSQLSQLGLPVITGVSSAPPVRAGERWRDTDLLAGLKLITLLSPQPFFDQIQAVDVSHHDVRGRLRLVLRTRDGGSVYWGFPPGEERSIEPSAAIKIDRLRELARAYNGSIDAGGQQVAIYGAAIEAARPMIARKAAEEYRHQ